MNIYHRLCLIAYLFTYGILYGQNANKSDEVETLIMEEQVIKIEPPEPQIPLKIKEIKPREYDFFRSFEDEVKAIPSDLFDIKVDNDESKVESLDKILTKERK